MNPVLMGLLAVTNTLATVMDQRGQTDIAEYARLAGTLAEAGDQYVGQLQEVTAKIQELVDQNREPTAREYIEARAERKRLSQELQGIRRTASSVQ